MRLSENDLGVDYEVANASDIDEMSRLLGDCFSKREPPAVAAGFTASQLEQLVQAFGSKVANERVSIIAKSRQSGEMVGALLVDDFGCPPPEGLDPLFPIFEPVIVFLDRLDDKYRETRTIVEGAFLYLFMIGVHEEWIGQGVATEMVRFCLQNGARNGFKVALTEATSESSRRVFQKVGFEEKAFENYKDFELRGMRPFESIQEHRGCALMETKTQ